MSAGPKDLTGFIDAFVSGPANMASSNITLPTATPATGPISLLPVGRKNYEFIGILRLHDLIQAGLNS